MSQVVVWIAVLVAELVVCAMDLVAAFSYMFTGGSRISAVAYTAVGISLLGDPLSFVLSIAKPRIGAALLAASATASLLIATIGYILDAQHSNLSSAALMALLFWAPKLLLALYLFQRSKLSSWRLAY